MSAHDLYLEAAICNNPDAISRLLNTHPIHSAEVQEYQYDMNALDAAATRGHLECVKLLIDLFDPKKTQSFPLQMAAANGHVECVKFLISLSDPLSFDMCLRKTIGPKPNPCFAVMLGVANPAHDDSLPLRLACEYGNQEMFDALYPLSNPISALEKMKLNRSPLKLINMLEQRMRIDEEKRTLEQSVGQSYAASRKAKI